MSKLKGIDTTGKKGSSNSTSGIVSELKNFLLDNYEIRVNELDVTKSEIKCKTDFYDKSFAITAREISLHAQEIGLRSSKSVLKDILESPHYITPYNPIKEYFESLNGKFIGKSHIDILCSHLIAKDFQDKKEKDYYQNRLNYIIRKWLVAFVANALEIKANDVAFGLAEHIGGMGKTHLINWLVPPALSEFIQISSKRDDEFSLRNAAVRNFIINYEELEGINSRSVEDFKATLSQLYLDSRIPGTKSTQKKHRIASVAFNTNKTAERGGFILPGWVIERRLGLIELSDINHKYSEVCNIDQIWAEALTLLKGDFDYIWNKKDFMDFIEYNKRYIKVTPAMQLLKMYFEPAEIEEEGKTEWVQPSELFNQLVKQRKITANFADVNDVKIGEALSILGYNYASKRQPKKYEGTRYCYLIKSKV